MRWVLKYGAAIAIALHLLTNSLQSAPTLIVDLFLYHLVALFIIASTIYSQRFNSLADLTLFLIALLLWTSASVVSTGKEFFDYSSIYPQIGYTLFYPFILLAVPRFILHKAKLSTLEIVDGAIITLGLSSILSAFALTRVLPNEWNSGTYFAIFNVTCDLLLLALALSSATQVRWDRRTLLIIGGVTIYALTDLLFFWQELQGNYSFGGLSDDGWLIGLAAISLALWIEPSEGESKETLHPFLIALSVLSCCGLLAFIALQPHSLPTFILIPTIATLFMAFIRMAIALRQAQTLNEEKVLARTDELTGLANRRRLISELSTLEEGVLLLMDLDGFKPINDRFGHEVGDKVLQRVAERFSRAMPDGTLLARLGGDEFGAIVPGSIESAMELALALRATLSYPVTIGGENISLGVSIGCATSDGSETLLQRADAAMYEAKRSGVGISSGKIPL